MRDEVRDKVGAKEGLRRVRVRFGLGLGLGLGVGKLG